MALSLGTGITHCLGDWRSATHSPLKSPQSPVALSLKTRGFDLTTSLSPSAMISTPYFLELIEYTPSVYFVIIVLKFSRTVSSSLACSSILIIPLLPREYLVSLLISTSYL